MTNCRNTCEDFLQIVFLATDLFTLSIPTTDHKVDLGHCKGSPS